MRAWILPFALGLSLHASSVFAQGNAAMAQERFGRGTTLYAQHDFTHALDEFQASLTLYGSPNTRLYVARCLRDLGRLDEAVPEYERASREAADRASVDPRYAATRDASQAEMLAILPHVAHITVNAPDLPNVATVRVSGRQIPREGIGVSMPVMPGRIEVAAEAEGFRPFRREVEIAEGAEQSVRVELQALPRIEGQNETPWQRAQRLGLPPPGSSRGVPRAVAYASFGVGAAGLIGFGVFAAMANSRFNTLNTQCSGMACTEADRDSISGGRTLQTLTNVSLGVGIVGAAAGVLFFVLGHPAESPPPQPTVRVGMNASGVTLDGVF